MVNVKIPISEIEVQLQNGRVTTPARIRFEDQSVGVKFYVDGAEIQFEFSLSGSALRLVVRDMAETVGLSVMDLYDFSNPPAPNNRLHLTGLRSASASR